MYLFFRSVPSLYLRNHILNDHFFFTLTFLDLILLANCLTSFWQMLLFAIGHINRDYTIPSIIFKALYSFKLCKIIRSFVSLVKNFYFISFLFLYLSVFLLFITSRSSILSEVKFLLILILCQEILTIVFHHVFQLFLCVFPMLLRKANKFI